MLDEAGRQPVLLILDGLLRGMGMGGQGRMDTLKSRAGQEWGGSRSVCADQEWQDRAGQSVGGKCEEQTKLRPAPNTGARPVIRAEATKKHGDRTLPQSLALHVLYARWRASGHMAQPQLALTIGAGDAHRNGPACLRATHTFTGVMVS